MKTVILGCPSPPDGSEAVLRAAEIIRNGGLVAIPTETVYGLGANALDPRAVRAVFEVKGRPQDNPLILHIADADEMPLYCKDVPEQALLLAERFWPGPLTLVLPARDDIPRETTGGLDTVALRCPDSDITRALIRAAGVPVAAPSANSSGRPSPTTAAHVLEDMDGRIPLILDGGPCCVGVESTIISLCGPVPRLLRPGGIPVGDIEAAAGPVEIDGAVARPLGEDETASAPGMKYRHYAPRAPLTVICGEPGRSAEYIRENLRPGDGVLCFSEYRDCFPGAFVADFGGSGEHEAQARLLFGALRSFDSSPAERIFAQCPDEDGLGMAVCNRLKKAAGFRVVFL